MDSTVLASQLDPEDLRDVVRAYQQPVLGDHTALTAILLSTSRDGLLVYFGYPQAHEDDAPACRVYREARDSDGNAAPQYPRGDIRLAVRLGSIPG